MSIKQKVGKKIFRVKKREVDLFNDKSSATMYTLIDITMEEYQRIKITTYVKSLEVLMVKNKNVAPQNIVKEKKLLSISDDSKQMLRKSHKNAISSSEFVARLEQDTLKELQELDDLDHDLKEAVYEFEDSNSDESLKHIAEYLSKYAREIYTLTEFEDLYTSIESLSVLLLTIDMSELEKDHYHVFHLYINSVRQDLASWRKNIFINQNSDNIHYLDSSFFNTSLQIKLLFSGDDGIADDSDDLEFF